MTQQVISDHHTLEALNRFLLNRKPRSILLLHGKRSYIESGLSEKLLTPLADYPLTQWDDFSSNPQYEDLLQGIEIAKSCQPDLIIAAGGGSVIDMAKLLAIFLPNVHSLAATDFSTISFEHPAIDIIAIPSTAGTGSEATHFSVIWKDGIKYSVAAASMLPKLAVLDPQFLRSQSSYLAACTMFDALSQAIESYWSIHSTADSRAYAKKAIELSLPVIAEKNKSDDMLAQLLIASHLAGQAINITKTTAAHAISYPFTARYHIPHGHAVSLTLPLFFSFNSQVDDSDCLDPRGSSYVRNRMDELVHLIGANTAQEATVLLSSLASNLGLNRTLSELGVIDNGDIQYIIDNAFNPQRIANNPRRLTKNALEDILLHIC